MAGTTVSMAMMMLVGAISKAASAAAAEMSLLMGVRKDIWFIKDELETMYAFLLATEATKNKNILLKVWAKQIRDLAYGIEDCLDEFMVHVKSHSLSCQLFKIKDRHRIANQIRNLKSRVEEVSSRNTHYNKIMTDASNSVDKVNSYMEDIRSHSAGNIDEAELVGFVKPKEELIKMMDVNAGDGLSKVICVVGMGGLGKTTLARKLYESKVNIVSKFSCCAWVTVSKSFSKIEMLKDMIRQLLGSGSLKKCLNELEGKEVQVDDLGNYLREELVEKRYFIVLDDLWTIDAWKGITNIAFPVSNNKCSRVIVTTRDVGLAEQCTSESLIYHLKHLQISDATNLLLRKSRKTREDMKNDKKMKIVVTKIMKKCGGLPLAILTIGGILATKKLTESESIYKQIPSELESNPSLEALRSIVTLSYNYLPSHLKSCFLYLSLFPEDFEIKRRRVVERWIVEGFVRTNGGVNIEDVGISYFNELINRSMIQPSRVNMEGIVKSCRVHDIMRDVMVSISRDENFVNIASGNAASPVEQNFRHVSYHGSKCQNIDTYWCNNVRSVTVFGERSIEQSSPVFSHDLRMLRAMDLEDAQFKITQKDIEIIGLLRHLKYVNIQCGSNSHVCKLPRSIGKLQYLQTLDIRNTYITSLPAEIGKLQSLHSLRCGRKYWHNDSDSYVPIGCLVDTLCLPMMFTPLGNPDLHDYLIAELRMVYSGRWFKSEGLRVPKGIGNLKELHILEVVDIKRTCRRATKELGKLTQLQKLRVVAEGASTKKCKILCAAIEELSSLSSLGVDAGSLKWIDSISCPPPFLRTLKLDGLLGEVPGWFKHLMNLVKLYLKGSHMKEGGKSMEILGALPNLMLLHQYSNSYGGEKLVFKVGSFPKLRKLDVFLHCKLTELRFEEGTSPYLEKIEIGDCMLRSGIIGIQHLPRLNEISLGDGCKVAKLGLLQGEVEAHPNHPVLRLLWGRGYHDLRVVTDVSSAAAQVIEVATGPSVVLSEQAAVGERSSQVLTGSDRSAS
ncbi:hypothetical protein VPH35_069945 [Triticum aestivum]|uniref:putative disease resistance RPP13-like protein 3 n=1 Tax=Triticum aestivum TaxID=4565 RepID=UPI001D015D33|nr:putative disease resistance RPP13-like protein 3 [Triticum aestivum]